jgi:hypothetical protein
MESFNAAMSAVLGFVGVLGIVASVIFVVGCALSAAAYGPAGLFSGSRLPTVGFIVLGAVYAVTQVFFRIAPYFYTADSAEYAFQINRAINVVVIAAIVFAAIAMLVRGGVSGVARVALFVPALLLVVIQFPISLPYPGVYLPPAVFQLTWLIVGIAYLLARPRGPRVTEPAENLAE